LWLVLGLTLVAGCKTNHTCRPGTVFVSTDITAPFANADSLVVTVQRAGAQDFTLPAFTRANKDARTETFELDFTTYTTGLTVTVIVKAMAGTNVLATGSRKFDLLNGCTATSIDLMIDNGDMGGAVVDMAQIPDLTGADLAGADLTPVTPLPDLSGADLTGVTTLPDLASGDLAQVAGTASAPLNVVATAQAGCKFSVTWQTPSSTGTSPITGYQIDSTPAGLSTTSATLSLTTPALTCGTSYSFNVRAQNTAGSGPPGSSSAVVAGDVPGLPQSVQATAPSGRVVANWTAANDNGYAISGYTVTLSNGTMQTVGGLATSATFGALNPGQMYSFTVYATNSFGNGPTASSNSVTFACTNNTYTLLALDSCTVQYGTPPLTTADPNVEAKRDPRVSNVDYRGFIKVSLSQLPSWAVIKTIQMSLNAGTVNGGTTPTPVLQVLYSPNTGWTRASIPTPTVMGTSPPVVSAQYPSGAVGYQNFDVNVGLRDWSADIAAGYLTLGIQNINTNYSFNTYYGTGGPGGTSPYMTIGTCE
jgi:uncharacterized protein YjbI with pentapeptide repeats